MFPDANREIDPVEDAERRRRIFILIGVLFVAAIAIGLGMMALVIALVPNDFVDSSFVNETDADVVIYVNGEGQAIAGPGATVSNFALYPRDEIDAAPRYVVHAYTLDFEQESCTGAGGCEDELRHCAVYTWNELFAIDWVASVTDNVAAGQRFGDVALDGCP